MRKFTDISIPEFHGYLRTSFKISRNKLEFSDFLSSLTLDIFKEDYQIYYHSKPNADVLELIQDLIGVGRKPPLWSEKLAIKQDIVFNVWSNLLSHNFDEDNMFPEGL